MGPVLSSPHSTAELLIFSLGSSQETAKYMDIIIDWNIIIRNTNTRNVIKCKRCSDHFIAWATFKLIKLIRLNWWNVQIYGKYNMENIFVENCPLYSLPWPPLLLPIEHQTTWLGPSPVWKCLLLVHSHLRHNEPKVSDINAEVIRDGRGF